MPTSQRSPDGCFQGSTYFYDSPDTDEFTPSYLEAGPLVENVGRRRDGTYPAWIDKTSMKSPIEQYVEWFNGIWHTGDPDEWNASVFTNQAVLIDPSGISKGAKQAAATLLRLFKYFPDLRGEVVSWAANERELFINWRLRIQRRGTKTPLLVAAVDKFCFVDGRVSFRLANFDIITLAGYLAENFGQDEIYDFFAESLWQAEKAGGMQLLPRMLWYLFKGIFLWPPSGDPIRLSAGSGDGVVILRWTPVEDAASYRISRATDLAGPYQVVAEIDTNGYTDTSVTNGRLYWYIVATNFKKRKLMPVTKGTPFVTAHSLHQRTAVAGSG
jgi:hypothetical protein